MIIESPRSEKRSGGFFDGAVGGKKVDAEKMIFRHEASPKRVRDERSIYGKVLESVSNGFPLR